MVMGLFKSKEKTKQKATPYREWQLEGILNRLQGLGATPQEFFPDQTYAGFDPLQEEAMQRREAQARAMQGGILDPTVSAWRTTLGAPDVASNPYVQGMLEQQQNMLNRNLRENLLPSIRSEAIAAGGLGGGRQGVAEGIALRGTQEALADAAARTQLGAYGQGLGQQRYGISAAPGIMQAQGAPADILSGVGAQRQAMDQRGINEAMARHEFAQEEPWQRLQREAGLFHPMTVPYATSETTKTKTPSPIGAAAQIAGLGSSLYSLGRAGGMFGGASTPAPGNFQPMPSFGGGGYSAMPSAANWGSVANRWGQFNPMQTMMPTPLG